MVPFIVCQPSLINACIHGVKNHLYIKSCGTGLNINVGQGTLDFVGQDRGQNFFIGWQQQKEFNSLIEDFTFFQHTLTNNVQIQIQTL